jgi:hypothetical protein
MLPGRREAGVETPAEHGPVFEEGLHQHGIVLRQAAASALPVDVEGDTDVPEPGELPGLLAFGVALTGPGMAHEHAGALARGGFVIGDEALAGDSAVGVVEKLGVHDGMVPGDRSAIKPRYTRSIVGRPNIPCGRTNSTARSNR